MYQRIFDIENQLDEAMFLFGARQVGKSTLLQERFKDAVYYDLLIRVYAGASRGIRICSGRHSPPNRPERS